MGAPKFTFELGTAKLPLLASLDPTTGKRRIEGISSSTLRDGHGDEITLKALEKMAKQAVGMTVWLNHRYEVPDDVFGTITRARVQDSGERDPKTGLPIWDLLCGMDVDEDNDKAVKTHNMIQKGRKLGISVGAMLPENGEGVAKSKTGGRYVLDDLDLVEMSLVGVPANPRCWATVATKALTEDPDFAASVVVKELDEEDREGRQTSKIDVEEGTDPDGKTDGIAAGEDVMDTGPGPDPDAPPPAAEAAEDAKESEQGQKDRESVEAGGNDDGIVTGEDIMPTTPIGEEGTKKTRVTVWDGDKTVQIDTGRSRKNGDDHSAQDADPESAGGLPSETSKALVPVAASSDDMLIRSLRKSLTRATDRANAAEAERDAAMQQTLDTIKRTGEFLDAVGKLPMGRRAVFDEVNKSFDDEFGPAIDALTFLSPEDRALMKRRHAQPIE
jgi:hypothetical protein